MLHLAFAPFSFRVNILQTADACLIDRALGATLLTESVTSITSGSLSHVLWVPRWLMFSLSSSRSLPFIFARLCRCTCHTWYDLVQIGAEIFLCGTLFVMQYATWMFAKCLSNSLTNSQNKQIVLYLFYKHLCTLVFVFVCLLRSLIYQDKKKTEQLVYCFPASFPWRDNKRNDVI